MWAFVPAKWLFVGFTLSANMKNKIHFILTAQACGCGVYDCHSPQQCLYSMSHDAQSGECVDCILDIANVRD